MKENNTNNGSNNNNNGKETTVNPNSGDRLKKGENPNLPTFKNPPPAPPKKKS